ncbi:ATP-dependent zinc metalloprotease FtsH [Patescibacteria group bacterium]|nr:ATP-dependent zinc metalloprotease FtsH [Patescibacteria group bacterium]
MPDSRQFWVNLFSTIIIFFFLVSAYSLIVETREESNEIPLSQLALDIEAKLVKSVAVKGDVLEVVYLDETEKESKKETGTAFTETLSNYGVSSESLALLEIDIQSPSGFRFWLGAVGPFLIPLLFIGLLLWFLSRQVKGAGMQAFSFGKSKARMIDPDDKNQRVTFKDIAGTKEAKEELLEIVDFLKSPKKFLDIGARIPKGIILMGAPGTGKTLLARAVAGEANVPFFTISGSEFVEMFVGVGASRVRDLFKTAKKTSPAIIFIDEIDAVGRVRGTGVGGGNDEREQTLNQILVEMDGFEQNEKVIVIAATNRPDVLDPALLRPGRFDRRVTIDLPDRKDREAILEVHARKKPFTEDVKLIVIAERTPGFSGADLASIMNEGAILAAREGRKKISQFDLVRSIEKVMMGPERKSHILSKREKRITAYHEAGHALVASVIPWSDPVHKVSIIARGHTGGYTLKLPFQDKRYHSKREFIADIATSLGGYIAEKMVFDDITTGPSSDLQQLTKLARGMVTKWGMSDNIGPIALETEDGEPIYGSVLINKKHSEKVAADIDVEVKSIIDKAYKTAENILIEHRKALNSIAEKLVDVETLEREEFEKLLILNGIKPKEDEEKEEDTNT